MAIRKLSLQLDLDSGTFTVGMKGAGDVAKQFQASIDKANKSVEAARQGLTGSLSSLQRYADAINKAATSKESLRQAQQQFIVSLNQELQTLGMSQRELEAYQASQLKLSTATKGLLKALNDKRDALAAVAEAEAKATAAATEGALAEQARLDAAEELIRGLQEEIIVLREGEEALTVQRAAMLGCEEEARALVGQIAILNAQHEEAAATAEAFARAEEEQAAAITRANAARAQLLASLNAATLAERESATAAETNGMAIEAMGGHARSGGRAIYEMNVLMHEFMSGRFRQAISSFSILLNNIGMIGGATLGITVGLGLLYGISRPIMEAAKNFETLHREAQSLGIDVDTLKVLGVASEELGMKTDGLAAGIGRMDQAFARARAGSKQQKDAFDTLGVSTKQNYTQQQLLQAVLKGWSKLDDGPRKVTVAMELLGRSGRDQIPVLNALAAKYDEFQTKAASYGILNPAADVQYQRLATNLHEAQLAAQGFANTMMAAFGPALNSMIEGFTQGMASMGAFFRQKSTIDAIAASFNALGVGIGIVGQAIGALVAYAPAIAISFAAFMIVPKITAWLVALNLEMIALAATRAMLVAVSNPMAVLSTGFSMLRAGVGGLVTAMGGPLVIAIAAGSFAFITLSNAINDAKNATQNFRSLQQGAIGALQAGLNFAQQYGLATDGIAGAMNEVVGQTPSMVSGINGVADAHRNAAEAALAQANAEKAITVARMRDAATQAYQEAQKYGKDANIARGQSLFEKPFKIGGLTVSLPGGSERYAGFQRDLQVDTSAQANAMHLHDLLSKQADDLDKRQITAAQALKGNGRSALGTTAGDPPKAARKHAKTPAEQAQDLLDRMDASNHSQNVFLNTDDPVEAAKQQMRDRLDSGEWKGVTSTQALGSKMIDAAGVKAGLDASAANFKQLMSDVQKDTKDAAAALADMGDDSSASGKKVHELDASVDALTNKQIELNKQLGASAVDMSKYTEEADKAKTAIANLVAAEDLKASKDALRSSALALKQFGMTDAQKAQAQYDETMRQAGQTLTDVYNAPGQNDAGRGDALDAFANTQAAAFNKLALDSKTPMDKLLNQWQDTTDQMQQLTANWANDFVTQLAHGQLNFKNFALTILEDWLTTWLKAQLGTPLQGLFNGLMDGMMSAMKGVNFGSIFSGLGKMISGFFHGGGIIGGSPTFSKAVHPGVFALAPKYHTGGIAGLQPGEVPAILKQGEGVFTPDQMKALGGKQGLAPPVQVNVINQSGQSLDAQQDGDMKFDGETYILNVVVNALNRPGALRTAMKSSR